jgi:hypothetical protein
MFHQSIRTLMLGGCMDVALAKSRVVKIRKKYEKP